jgi:ABC-2 type transport system ATP-binding protein
MAASCGALEVRGLSFAYRTKDGAFPVLKDLSFKVLEGRIFGLLGPNGSGKTTTFHIISTFLCVPPGKVFIFGRDVAAEPALVRRDIGIVFQLPSLDRHLTVEENLKHQGHLYGLSGGELAGRIDENLARMGLTERREDKTGLLSGGLKRRAELAKGLLHRPRLLILDEPSTGLDPGARIDLWDTLADLKKSGTTIILTTHWMEEAEKCDRLAILNEGRVVAEGSPDELKASIGGDVVSMESADPEALVSGIKEKFALEANNVDGIVRIEKEGAHTLIPKLAEAFPGSIRSMTLGKPTLEDVFIRETGHSFRRGAE